MRGLILGAAAVLAAAPAFADVKAGVDAWTRGDYRKAVDEWRPLAVAGDADAQFNLGQAYKLGRGVPEDPGMAESWFRKAALQGHLQAQDNYGLALFQNGRKGDAATWLEKSAARGEARAQLVLGTMLFNGDGVTRDYPRAYALMTRASAQGLRSASETLAQMDQYITPADRQRGVELARQMEAQAKLAPAFSTPGRTAVTAGDAGPVKTADANRRPDPVKIEEGPAKPPRPAATPTPAPSPIPGAKPARPLRQVPPPVKPAAAPAPKPAATASRPAAPASKAPAPAASGRYRVQLGAFRDAGNARALWSRVGSRVGGQPTYSTSGGLTRLQAGPFRTRAEASRACAKAGVGCVVVNP